jgi:hypothetical protein
MAADGFMLDPVVVDGKLVDYRTFDVGMITEQYAGIEGVGVATVWRMADIMFFTQADEYQKDFENFYWMAWECEAFSRLLHSNFKVVYDDLSPGSEQWARYGRATGDAGAKDKAVEEVSDNFREFVKDNQPIEEAIEKLQGVVEVWDGDRQYK